MLMQAGGKCKLLKDVFSMHSIQTSSVEQDNVVAHRDETGQTRHVREIDISEPHSQITVISTSAMLAEASELDNNDKASVATVASDTVPWPAVWSKEQYEEFRTRNPWLDSKNGKLGCKACKNITDTQLLHSEHMSCASEWINYSVTCTGIDRKNQLQALLSKMHRHKESAAHARCMELSLAPKKDIRDALSEMGKEQEVVTAKLFRTSYYIAKRDRPFDDYESLLQLQQLNGINSGLTLQSRFSATAMVSHIANDMRKTICDKIVSAESKLCVLIDESTTISHLSVLVVYIRASVDGVSDPVFIFLDLIELPNQTSGTIAQYLCECLIAHGFTKEYLLQNWISFACDGASVMLGRRSGVATLLHSDFPSLIIWHCLNHRLELAVHDTLQEVNATNHFKIFMDSLYSLYSQSPKNQRELKIAARELDVVVTKIGRVLDTRWVASSFRAVSAVWKAYLPLCHHFEQASRDESRTLTERSKYKGLLKRLHSPQFVRDCALLHDALDELSNVSELLQSRSMTLPRAHKLMVRCVRILDSFRDTPGEKMKEAEVAVQTGMFKTVTLEINAKIQSVNEKQFLASLVTNMRQRLFTSVSSNTSRMATVDGNTSELKLREDYNELIEDLSILEADNWTGDASEDVHFGEEQIKRLCARFSLDKRAAINGFRDFVDSAGQNSPEMLKPLLICTRTLPCSTAECERAFSSMNVIISPSRNSLLIGNVSSLLFIKINGPPINKFVPSRYVQKWLRSHVSAMDKRARRPLEHREETDSRESMWALL